MTYLRIRGLAAILFSVCVLASNCRSEIVVRLSSTVYADGSLDRSVEVRGRTAEREQPEEEDWLESKVGLRLAEPEAWARSSAERDRLSAEGFFSSVDQLPALLAYRIGGTTRPARVLTRLDLETRGVLTRWSFSENHGDPFGPQDVSAAIDTLVELVLDALRSELRATLGSDVVTGPAEQVVRGEIRGLAAGLLGIRRSTPASSEQRFALWDQVLQSHGIEHDPKEQDFEIRLLAISRWARRQVAGALSTEDLPVRSEDLAFWPVDDDFERQLGDVIERVWGSEDRLAELVEPHLEAIGGYYGTGQTPEFRFEISVELPGTLLRTSGTPDGRASLWLFRDRDLAQGESFLRAVSVEPVREALVALGARRDLSRRDLVRLEDLLWKRSPDGALGQALDRAIHGGSLDLLRNDEEIPEELLLPAWELADLLDPAINEAAETP